MIIDHKKIKAMEKRERADFINRLNGFKSPVLIGTQNIDKVTNLTLVSSLFHLGADPPLLGIIFRPNTVPRHGLENILANKEFTINFINEKIVKKAHQTSARYDQDVSEFEATNLQEEYLNDFSQPFVQSSDLKLAMNLREKIDIKYNGTHLIIGEIKFINSRREFSDLTQLSNIAVNGLDTYYNVKKLTKLSYAKPDSSLIEL